MILVNFNITRGRSCFEVGGDLADCVTDVVGVGPLGRALLVGAALVLIFSFLWPARPLLLGLLSFVAILLGFNYSLELVLYCQNLLLNKLLGLSVDYGTKNHKVELLWPDRGQLRTLAGLQDHCKSLKQRVGRYD